MYFQPKSLHTSTDLMLVILHTLILKTICFGLFLWLFIMKQINNCTEHHTVLSPQFTSHITDLMLVILRYSFWKQLLWHIFYDYYYETKLITYCNTLYFTKITSPITALLLVMWCDLVMSRCVWSGCWWDCWAHSCRCFYPDIPLQR